MKEFSEFHKHSKSPDGHQCTCKECKKKIADEYYWNRGGKQKYAESNKKWKQNNKDKVLKTAKKHYDKNRDRILQKLKTKRENDKDYNEKKLERTRKWRDKNKEHVKEYRKVYHKKYYAENTEIYVEAANKRRALKLNAVPLHLKDCEVEKTKLVNIYKLRDLISQATGVQHHVDHMWPLADGGPHWSGNLQIIPAEDNLSKGAAVDLAIKATIQEMLAEEERLHAEH
jgi:hypothetical protein